MADDKPTETRRSARGSKATKATVEELELELAPADAPEAPEGQAPPEPQAPPEAATPPEAEPAAPPTPRGARRRTPAEEEEAEVKSQSNVRPPDLDDGEVIVLAEAWLRELIRRLQLDLTASGEVQGDDLVFNISGPDADTMIGRSRQSPRVVTAMQTILAEKIGRQTRKRILVDIGGYKQQREEHLSRIAKKLGETTRSLGRNITLAGLNNYERRVIHQELADEKGLRTESTDHGIFRKIRVIPD